MFDQKSEQSPRNKLCAENNEVTSKDGEQKEYNEEGKKSVGVEVIHFGENKKKIAPTINDFIDKREDSPEGREIKFNGNNKDGSFDVRRANVMPVLKKK